MRKIFSFMHISLDGFVAGPDGEMDWIRVDDELFDHVGKRIGEGDTALYGRKTYEMMEGYWPTAGDQPGASRHDIDHSRWYAKVHKIVLSRSLREADLKNTTVIGDDLANRIEEIKQQPGGDILMFGSPTATHALMQQHLIDGYWLFVNPVVLGKGIALFEGIRDKQQLKLLSTRQFASGVVELSYEMDNQ